MDVTKPTTIAEADSIDLAIISPGDEDLDEVDAFLQGLALSVRDGGIIISMRSIRLDSFGTTFKLNNGASICRVEKQKTVLSIDGETEFLQKSVTRVSVLNGAAQASVAQEMLKVCDDLATQKWVFTHSSKPLEDVVPDSGIVVIMDELFSSVMETLDAKQWELLQHLAKIQRPLLWVTSRSTDPTRAAAVGFLATIRAEEQVPFFTLDVEANT